MKKLISKFIAKAVRPVINSSLKAQLKPLVERVGLLEKALTGASLSGQIEYLVRARRYHEAVQLMKTRKELNADAKRALIEYINVAVLAPVRREWTGHGIVVPFRYYTEEQKRDYLHLGVEVIRALRSLTPDVCFGFGTVLGLVRDGDLIPHDDDVDIIICIPNATDIATGVDILTEHLTASGFKIMQRPGHIKVLRDGEADLDVFPGYREGDFVNWRPGPRDGLPHSMIFPAEDRTHFNTAMPMPKEPERYLAMIYGDTWRTPLPSFRHVWGNFDDKLKDIP